MLIIFCVIEVDDATLSVAKDKPTRIKDSILLEDNAVCGSAQPYT